MLKRNLLKILFSLVIPIVLFSCGPPPVRDVIWPGPPDIPRIKFVKSYYGPSDVVKKSFVISTILGSEGYITFSKPMGLHIDDQGRIYVVDTGKKTIFVLDKEKKIFLALNIRGRQAFKKPVHISTDSKGNMFATDAAGAAVVMFDKDGQYIKHVFIRDDWKRPTGIVIDKKRGRIYISDTQYHRIRVFDEKTLLLVDTIGGVRGSEEGEMNFPTHITVNRNNGDLLVTDTMNARVQIFDYKGRFKLTFGQFGDGAGMFARPKGIAVDSENHIYVADAGFNNIQIFDYEGQILMSFSGYGPERGNVVLPSGVFIDKDDFIYVSDSFNERINIYEFLGDKHKTRVKRGITLDK